MIDAKTMSNEHASDVMHVALVGPENNGKSTLVSTAPGVKLFMDYDKKKQVLAGKKETFALTFQNPGDTFKMPEAAEEVLDVMTGLEKSLDLYHLCDKNNRRLFPEAPEGTIVRNLVHDSMASLGKLIMDYELYTSGDLRREIKIGSKLSVNIPKNFDAWNAEMRAVESIVLRSFALPVNVYCIFHEQAEETADSSIEKPKFTGRVSIYPVRYKNLLMKYFTDIWRVKLTSVQGKYVPRVYVLPDFNHDNGTSMLLDAVEEPDITNMIHRHNTALAKLNGVQVSTPQGPIKAVSQVAGLVKK